MKEIRAGESDRALTAERKDISGNGPAWKLERKIQTKSRLQSGKSPSGVDLRAKKGMKGSQSRL